MSGGEDNPREVFWRNLNGFIYFQAMATGCTVGLFDELGRSPGATLAALGTTLSLPTAPLRALLLGLCEAKLLRRDADGRYFNSAAATAYLDSASGKNAIAQVELSRRLHYPAFAHLTESVRAGRNAGLDIFPGDEPVMYSRLAHSPELHALFYENMLRVTERAQPMLIANDVFRTVRHVLDVGGGNGANAIALARAHPQLRVTLLDLPTTAPTARAKIAEAQLSDRISVEGTDVFTTPLPRGADLVLYSHFIEIFDEARAAALLASAHAALPPSGKVVVLGISARDDETGGPSGARLSLYFLTLVSGKGLAYPAHDYARWMKAAGFRVTQSAHNEADEHCLVVGEK